MKQKRLGRTELVVSELGLGGIPFTRLDLDGAASLIKHCFDRGVTFFDTAPVYGDSEVKIGTALEAVRDQVVLATKTFIRDAEGATLQLGKSLERLRTDHIDLYQIHNMSNQEALDTVLAPGGVYEALAKCESEGKIRHMGFSSHNLDIAVKACRTGKFATVQIPFNFIEHDPAETLFREARDQDMGIVAMKPLGGGLLDRADLCFRFLQQYEDVIPIPGIESTREFDENLEYYQNPRALSQHDREEIEKIRSQLGSKFCHRCEYCQPCPQGVKIHRVLLFKGQVKRFSPQMAMNLSRDPMKKAVDCVQCGECEEKCPYGLPVPDMVSESLDYFRQFCEKHGQ